LNASRLSFIHPHTSEKLTVNSQLPKRFDKIFPKES